MSDFVYINIKPREPQDNIKARQMDFHGCWYHTINDEKSTGVTFRATDWLVWTNGDSQCPMVYSDKEFNDMFYIVIDTSKNLHPMLGSVTPAIMYTTDNIGISRTMDHEVPAVQTDPRRFKVQAALDIMNELVHSL